MKLSAKINPAISYQAAINRIDDISIRPKTTTVNPISKTILLTHGHPTPIVYVLLHGYTNSPQQFRELGQRLFANGHNVLIPRMPHHGLSDRLTLELQKLRARNLTDYANRAVDVAAGLGDKVNLIGLSTGGVLAAYLSQHRGEVDTAMLIAPSFGVKPVRAGLTNAVTHYLNNAPNKTLWWHEEGDMGETMLHAYPRWSTKALGAILRVGLEARRLAKRNRPKIRQAILMINENDQAINQTVAEAFGDRWERHGVPIARFTFPASDGLDHDVIDPEHPDQNIEYVYSKIFALLDLTTPLAK